MTNTDLLPAVLRPEPAGLCDCVTPVMQELRNWGLQLSTGDVVRSIQCNGCYRPLHPRSPLHPDHHLHIGAST